MGKKMFAIVAVVMVLACLSLVFTACNDDKTEGVNPSTQYKRVDANGNEKADGDYVLFGYYPQTIKKADVTVSDKVNERGYFTGSDGADYAKVKSDYSVENVSFSDGTAIVNETEYYFKVEPIKWRIVEEKDSKAFLISENIIWSSLFYQYDELRVIDGNTVYGNNYKYSDARLWLNGQFYDKAFDSDEQSVIVADTVANGAATTWDKYNKYACEDTTDKIFLPSFKDITNIEYGFDTSFESSVTRQKSVSDFALLSSYYFALESVEDGCGAYWLRSPGSEKYYANYVQTNGNIINDRVYKAFGIVPALRLRLA